MIPIVESHSQRHSPPSSLVMSNPNVAPTTSSVLLPGRNATLTVAGGRPFAWLGVAAAATTATANQQVSNCLIRRPYRSAAATRVIDAGSPLTTVRTRVAAQASIRDQA